MPKGKSYSLRNPPASEITGKKGGGTKGKKKVGMKKIMKSTGKKATGNKNKSSDY